MIDNRNEQTMKYLYLILQLNEPKTVALDSLSSYLVSHC